MGGFRPQVAILGAEALVWKPDESLGYLGSDGFGFPSFFGSGICRL